MMKEVWKNKNIKSLNGEIWLSVVGYEKLYAISNKGRIKSYGTEGEKRVWACGKVRISTKKDRILSQKKHNRGYKMICLFSQDGKKYTTIHRLVAEAFIPNPHNKRTVNHINGIKWDNRVENLEWATDSENGLHAFRSLGRKPVRTYLGRYGDSHNKSKPILQYEINGTFIRRWGNAQEAYRELGINSTGISVACRRGRGHNRAKGFLWKFEADKSQLIWPVSNIVDVKN